ncbi:hypothetical protein [Methylomonas koyamae]|uniref:hypothetical protein n=1 Tax=Methylomonas koyamae TaxID=702114 RepID=UPI001C338156|nr:hypothetical protein [Methylomonas koyamae]BBL57759.1 hypothetical protein MKFW12EY_13720 [Methylomonas koyamae]
MSIIENALNKAAKQGLVITSERTDSVELDSARDRKISDANSFVGEKSAVDLASKAVPDRVVNIDWQALSENGFIDSNNAKSQLAEEFRVIKRPLVNNTLVRVPARQLLCNVMINKG